MTDLFTESPPQESEAARPAIGTPPDAKACGGDLGPNGFTVEYFACRRKSSEPMSKYGLCRTCSPAGNR